VSSPEIFAAAAQAFVRVVDSADEYSRDEFVRELERALVDLYAAGLTLEDLQPDDDSKPRDGLTNDDAAALQRRLGHKFAEYDFYNVVFDPYDRSSSPVTGSLADDVTDVYRDLQEGFAELHAGRANNALWQWKFGFDYHWGKHAAEAIYTLYNLRSRLVGGHS
jgi:hypothetical protein